MPNGNLMPISAFGTVDDFVAVKAPDFKLDHQNSISRL